ncbi:MAG: hypothetical protein JW966_07965 [Anaerolineae bacterium]|nr:hypothetical protein [Anaerolineae bacterium]
MPDSTRPDAVCVGGIFIDDIVYPDGRTHMEVLGGGVVHAAAGLLIWNQRAGIFACAGHDLPDSARLRLERDFDLQGLIWLKIPQVRAWQLFEWDGKRTEIYRVDVLDPFIHEPLPDQMPPAYHRARGIHLLRDAAPLRQWRELFPDTVLFWEPLQQYMIPANAAEFRAALPDVDIVSPNWLEARQVYGVAEPEALVRAMLDDGARIAVLRMGEHGSMVGQQGNGHVLRLPAVPVPELVDQTGAGNSYGGGFLAGWLKTGDLATAACYGAVSASFALEAVGVADPPADDVETLRETRYRWVTQRLS